MPVYVDNAKHPYRGMLMCHMLADSLEELHAMARELGLKPEWFQNHGTPHYDICRAKRRRALQLGVTAIDRRETVRLIRTWREKKQSEEEGAARERHSIADPIQPTPAALTSAV